MVKVVIGDRMGKGQNIAKGIEAEGAEVIVIPGMAADMKLGDTMYRENADLGLSFCGSGGAGALMAANKYKYTERHSMRSVQEGITAINDGIKVLGFGFMDTEELGRELTKAYKKKYGA
ncbi:MAG: glycine-rich SFCGS family protein [Streptococcaceae bacterium]|nr:glycine-rich SFCGS family protein [Streptococcaceae bacterium]